MSGRLKVLLPGHKYIGPGNELEGEPIDKDDEIAQVHDNAYHQAKDKYSIVQEDDIAIHSFAKDALETGNVHSALGALGIGAKRVIETAIGVQYPRMPPTPAPTVHPFGISKKGNPLTAPQWQYALNQRTKNLPQDQRYERQLEAHQHLYKALGEHGYLQKFKNIKNVASLATIQKFAGKEPSQDWDVSWGDAGDFDVDLFDPSQVPGRTNQAANNDKSFNVDGVGRALLDRLSQGDAGHSAVMYGAAAPSNLKRPSSPNSSGDDLHTPKKQAVETQIQKEPNLFYSDDESSSEDMIIDSPPASIDENGPTSEPANIPGDASGKVGETDPSQGLPVSAAVPGSPDGQIGAEGMSGAGGGGASPAPLAFFRAKGFKDNGGSYSFHNSFRMRSYGTANFQYQRPQSATVLYSDVTVTSMVDLPVDHVSFYIPYSVFAGVPVGTRIKKVGIKVTPIGNSVSFDTNSSASGSAATQHTLYGMASVGLNKELPTQAFTITRTTGAPMTLQSVSAINNSDTTWATRIWGPQLSSNIQTQSAANNDIIIPHTYLGIVQPSNQLSTGTGSTLRTSHLNTISNQTGYWPLNRHITVFPMAAHIGKPLINFEIDIDPIAIRGRRMYVNGFNDTHRYRQGVLNMTSVGVRTSLVSEGVTKFNTPTAATNFNEASNDEKCYLTGLAQPTILTYNNAKLTMPDNDIHFKGIAGKVMAIPSINFGIEAVQANVPEAVASYINASVDYYVETFMEFEPHLGLGDWNYGDGSISRQVLMNNHMYDTDSGRIALDNVPLVLGEKTYSGVQ